MEQSLYLYHIRPRVLCVGQKAEVALIPLDPKYGFDPAVSYQVMVLPQAGRTRAGNRDYEPKMPPVDPRSLPDHDFFHQRVSALVKDGQLRFSFTPDSEGSWSLRILQNGEARPEWLMLYALEPDLYALRPLKGDFHVHSCRSDGQESPAVVAASYRTAGYDFTSLSDHERFAPSEEMIRAYSGVKHDLLLVHGEEVHAPENYVHIIHFGGNRSVNEQFQKDPDRYFREVNRIVETEDIPYPDRFLYAANLWCVRRIREAGGLAVYCHPHWVYNGQHNDPDALSRLFLSRREFDAFELIGGQLSHENDLQVALWNDLRGEGVYIPPLGASDSHGTLNAGLFNQMFTVVFARDNSVPSILEAVRAGNCAAVEYRHRETPPLYYNRDLDEFSVHGPYRLVAYVRFLLTYYFPCTEKLAQPEGLAMREYLYGAPGAAERLESLSGRTEAYYKAIFGR